MKVTIISIILVLLILTKNGLAQSVNSYEKVQDSLSKLSSTIWKQKTDNDRLKANEIFFRKFESILQNEAYLSIPFDSISGITKVATEDLKFSVFTWNVPLADGTNKYFGFIKVITDSSIVIPLQSVVNTHSDFTTEQLNTESWYGAIYYKLILVEIGSRKVITLLGWDGYTADANRKIIDIISLDENGIITFGMPVFKTAQGIKSRIVMEYSEKSNMLLRYDYQSVMIEKRNKIKKVNSWLIVMDRLVPMDPSLQGIRKFYVPAGDTYDGFMFRDGNWILVEDIEVRNKVDNTK